MFHVADKELRLYPILEEPAARQLFFIFRDQTSGHETYGAGGSFTRMCRKTDG